MTDALRYVCMARLDGADRVFLWEGEDPGPARVVVDRDGFVVVFPSVHAAREVAAVERWDISPEEVATYDLDSIEAWCPSDEGIHDCSRLLKAWNLLADLPDGESLFRAADARALSIYDKLFRGCNLPSMTQGGEHYVPLWTKSETAAVKHLLLLGLAELRSRLR